MSDELSVTGIECFAHHGVFDFERREGQVFVVDLVLGIDTRPAAASDDLVERVIEAITAAARTGKVGDGKIFVTDLQQVMRIRTGEAGDNAL